MHIWGTFVWHTSKRRNTIGKRVLEHKSQKHNCQLHKRILLDEGNMGQSVNEAGLKVREGLLESWSSPAAPEHAA
jgi:hypothetical protein